MGLVKTVFSPLTNTTPLVTIILVIILVAIFRFSGGGISVNNSDKHKLIKSNNTNKEAVTEKKDDDFKADGTIKIDADEFDRMIKLRAPKKPKKAENNNEPKNDFKSIEEALGLR